MTRVTVALLLTCVLAVGVIAQKQIKAWPEWSKGDVQKILNHSGWGQTQEDKDLSEMFYSPTAQGRSTAAPPTAGARGVTPEIGGNDRNTQGALNQATGVKFHIRWLSAKPIRQALARQVVMNGGTLNEQLRGFAENDESRVVIGVWFESNDQRFSGKVMQGFNSAVTETLKNFTYLERKDGKRVFLHAYVPPQQNPFGAALFIFPRMVDEKPLLAPDSGDVRFVAELKDLKLNMKYKVADMLYNGQLEY